MDLNFETILQDHHGKEIIIYTKSNHHYQGKLVGSQCVYSPYQCSHLIMLLFGNYVDVAVGEITDIKILSDYEEIKKD